VAQAYLILAQLAGQLMAFQGDRDPAELPPLLRMDLRRTFGSLFDVISELVSATVRTDYIALDLALAPGGARGTKLTDEVARCRRFIIGVHSPGQDDESLALNLPRYTKVAASDQIERLKTASVTGVRMIHRPRVPEIPTQPGMVLFQLETTDDVWQSVLASRSLSLFIPKPYDQGSSTTIRLLAIP
jgi:predicted component of type VI protein secretion system